MKYKILAIFTILCLVSNIAHAAKTIMASGHPDYPPVMWQEGNNIVGVGPEIARIAFEDLGIIVDSVYKGSLTQVENAVKEEDIDIITGIYMTEQRKEFMEYSVPFMKDPVVIFVIKGKGFPYNKWDDLAGKKGLTTIGDSFGNDFDSFISKNLTISRSIRAKDNFDKILSGEADYFISAMYSGLIEANKLGISEKIEYLPTYATSETFYISMFKKSKFIRYMPQLNEKIEKLIKDGTIDRLIDEKMKYYLEGKKGE